MKSHETVGFPDGNADGLLVVGLPDGLPGVTVGTKVVGTSEGDPDGI